MEKKRINLGGENIATSVENEVNKLYQQLIVAWNKRDAAALAEQFKDDGEMIGFDGSQIIGREEIFSHLDPIFKDHPTAPFITKVKGVRHLSPESALLRAITGMIPPEQEDIKPEVNTHHTLVAVKIEEKWQIQLFQNTPAQFQGRPELVEQMTEEF